MSLYMRRFSRFPRPVTSADRYLQRTSGLGAPGVTDNPGDPNLMPVAGKRNNLPIWLYPPINWENIDLANYVALPAIGATATVLTFTVPVGRNGVINKIGNNFVGAGWVEGSGDVIWRILVDGGTPPGATSYDNILASLGSPANPVGISGFRIFENQTLTLVAFNNAVVVASQKVGARLMGHMYPRDIEEQDLWI